MFLIFPRLPKMQLPDELVIRQHEWTGLRLILWKYLLLRHNLYNPLE